MIKANADKYAKRLDYFILSSMMTKMEKYDLKDFNMNGKTLLIACLTALFSLSGCALFRGAPEEVALPDTDETMCLEENCETDPFVNYAQTRADFREDGELSPRDPLISQSGAGNNLSAAIPPSIENEVISYEEQVENETGESQVAQNAEADRFVTEQQIPSNQVAEDEAEEEPFTVAQNEEKTDEAEATKADQDKNAEQKQEQEYDDDGEDPVRDWYAEEGQNVKALLTEWSAKSGWRLVWNTNRNYVLNAGAMFRGRFADVSSALIRAFARARPAPVATFYKGNRVLVVETMEDENAYD